MHVLILDAYHLGDPLFLSQLARDLKARGGGLVLVHATAEAGERAIESGGGVARSEAGVWVVAGTRAAAAVERAGRELNRRIAHELNEAGVHAVRVMGADRGLLRRAGGGLEAGRAAWLATLAAQGAVPVVASLVAGAGGVLEEADAAAAAGVLARALGAPEVWVLRGAGQPLLDRLAAAGTAARVVAAADLRAEDLPDGAPRRP